MNLHSDTSKGDSIELGTLPFDEAEVAIHRYHSSIVRSVGELGDEDLPAVAACVVVEGLAQPRVSRYPTCDSDLTDT